MSTKTLSQLMKLKTVGMTFMAEYLGHIKDVRSIIEKSSIYVLLSYNEGTPRSVLEAMSIGRPIITTDVSGCRKLLSMELMVSSPSERR